MDLLSAQNRFGLGPKFNSISHIDKTDITQEKTLINQCEDFIKNEKPLAAPLVSSQILEEIYLAIAQKQKAKDNSYFELVAKKNNEQYKASIINRFENAINSNNSFPERLVYFWSNHFAISIEKLEVKATANAYENEAIRPNILGNFRDLLLDAITHPAMQIYLNQNDSIGPNSYFNVNRKNLNKPPKGFNENLAREILELHTLGVNGGYNQNDVTEFAKALTGLTIYTKRREKNIRLKHNLRLGQSYFDPDLHEVGEKKFMGHKFKEEYGLQSLSMIDFIAKHPSTARHIATKLATHFHSDNPPKSLIEKLSHSFLENNGHLYKLYQTLISAPEMNDLNARKFRPPWDWLIFCFRFIGVKNINNFPLIKALNDLGQPIWQPRSPKGYSDSEASLLSPDALYHRAQIASLIAKQFGAPALPEILINKLIGAQISKQTIEIIKRAESEQSSLALFFISPEALRR